VWHRTPNAAGLLVCFYKAEQQVWGFDPADQGAWHVKFIQPNTGLVRTEFPSDLPEQGRYRGALLPVCLRLTSGRVPVG
jgi:hypothetical protein